MSETTPTTEDEQPTEGETAEKPAEAAAAEEAVIPDPPKSKSKKKKAEEPVDEAPAEEPAAEEATGPIIDETTDLQDPLPADLAEMSPMGDIAAPDPAVLVVGVTTAPVKKKPFVFVVSFERADGSKGEARYDSLDTTVVKKGARLALPEGAL